MITKIFELRDKGTFIPVIAIRVKHGPASEAERYLLARAGFRSEGTHVILVRAECAGVARNASYDPYAWGGRTYPVAHLHIIANWDKLSTGDVIDIEFLLGETTAPKSSERLE